MSLIKTFKTIRFKLTLFYSVLVFLFCATLVGLLNLYLNSYLTSDPVMIPKMPPMIGTIQNNGTRVLISFNDLQQEERNRIKEIRLNDLREIQQSSMIALAPIAILSFAIGYFISGRFLSPIADLGKQFKSLQTKDLGKTIPVKVEDEVGQLVNNFNGLSVRLKNSFDTQEQFVQDAAHELKTPLTVIQTNLDTIVDDPTISKDELRSGMKKALAGVKKMRKLTESLLTLSETVGSVKKEVAVKDIMTQCQADNTDYAVQEAVKLTFKNNAADRKLQADSLALKRALNNIIENGIKYSSGVKQAEVKVTVDENDQNLEICIEDNGPGIEAAERKRIFSRFYRTDKSRNSKNGGFGLGLAISHKIIKEHNGSISLESKPGETKFKIRLPLDI